MDSAVAIETVCRCGRSGRSSSPRASYNSPTASSAPSSHCEWQSRASTRPAWCSAPISPASPWVRLRCSRIIERIGHIRAYAAFAGLVAAADCHHAAPGRIARLGDPARDHWLRLCRDFRHNRELADRKGPAIRARAGLLDLYGRHVPGSCAGPAFDSPSGYQGGGIVQCDRRTVRCGTDHGYHGPSRATPSERRGRRCPMVCSREPRLSPWRAAP